MKWLLRTMRWQEVLLSAVAVGLAAAALRGRQAPVPSIAAGQIAPVPVIAVLGIVPAMIIIRSWNGLPHETAAVAVRPLSVLRVIAACLAIATVAVAAFVLGGTGTLLEITRDSAGLLGIALIGGWLRGARAAVLLPVAYLLVSFLLGRGAGQTTSASWAWILRDGGDLVSHLVAWPLLIVGFLVCPALPQRSVRLGDESV